VLVETDVLIAFMDLEDPNHEIAKRVFTEYSIALSPYALIELDLLIRSSIIVVRDYSMFWRKLDDVFKQYRVEVIRPRSIYFTKAHELRIQYNLTYFDSLHAATAIVEDLELVSFDRRAYSEIASLKYQYPKT